MGAEEVPDHLAGVELPARRSDEDSRQVLLAARPGVARPDDAVEDDRRVRCTAGPAHLLDVRTVGDLIGLPMLDDNDVTLGRVERVVRTPEGKIRLIVGYSQWFGWFGRPVAVPIEVVAILGRQIASLDMPPAEYAAAPTWAAGRDMAVPDDDIIRIAITRR